MSANESSTISTYRRCCTEEHLFALTAEKRVIDNDFPMQVRFALFADYALVSVDQKVSLLGLFDEINAPGFPFQCPLIFMAVSIQAESSESRDCQLEILLWDEDGNAIFTRKTPVTFPTPSRTGAIARHNEIMGVGGLLFSRAGDHALIVSINGEERTRVVLRVNGPLISGSTP